MTVALSTSRKIIIAATASTLVFGVGGYIWAERSRPPVLEIYVFDLVNGRSMLIITPDDRRILVNGGGSTDVIREITDILPFYSRRIDIVMATNTFNRDISGLVDVLQRYSVETLYVPKVTPESLALALSTDETYAVLLATARARHVSVVEAVAGNTVLLGHDVVMKVLFPVEADGETFAYSRASAPEIVFRLTYRSTSAVYLGDASHKVQEYIGHADARPTDALIFSGSARTGDISTHLMRILDPTYLVYARDVRKPAVGGMHDGVGADPGMAGILTRDRWNIREKGTAHLVSDGVAVSLRS